MKIPPIQFDHAAGSVLRPELFHRMEELLQRYPYNPHGLTCYAEECRRGLSDAQSRLLKALGILEGFAVIWCAGGTDAANIALRGLCEKYAIACDEGLHPALFRTAEALKGRAMNVSGTLLAISLVNNEIGTIRYPERKSPRDILLVDGCQAVGHIPLPVPSAYDMMIISGRKIGAPASAAALVVRRSVMDIMTPVVTGGGQQRGIRSGTVDVVSAILMADAVEQAVASQHRAYAKALQLNHLLRDLLPEAWPIFSPDGGSPFILSFAVPRCEGAVLTRILSESYGILIGAGSACSAESREVSPTLKAMGVPPTLARAMLRVSFEEVNTTDEVEKLAISLKQAVATY